jgi:prephenate dehydratase
MRVLPQKTRVAFQGERGAFSEEAAVALLGEEIQLVPRPSLESLFAAVEDKVADYSLVPIENTIAGSIHRSYDLLLGSRLQIIGESIIPVVHLLIGCPGSVFESIEMVESHPVALAQCEQFFAEHPSLERVATDDTAGSVQRVVRRGDPTRAAIAGERAARIYGGVILSEHLEDHIQNYTRFVLLGNNTEIAAGADKISLIMRLAHRPGALHRALEVFAHRDIDLLKIESRPLSGSPWQYRFYLDLQGCSTDSRVIDALSELSEQTDELRILGCYQSCKLPLSGKNSQGAT